MATIKEVAKEAGVSVMTVSRVINNPEIVSEDKVKAVYDAMKKLKYLPNQAAKSLVSNKTGVVKVLIPNTIGLNHPFSMNFIAGISESLSKHLYSFSLVRNTEITQKCDGVIVMGVNNDEELEIIRNMDIPVVWFGRSDSENFDSVDVDNYHGGYLMTEYLISQGHRDIGMIVINEKKNFCYDRLNGYMQALKDHNIPVSSNLIKYAENMEGDGYRTAMELISTEKISAVFCSSDALALGAVRAAKFLKKNIPHDLSIAGFDGLGIHLLTEPKITTIGQPVYQIGIRLADLLLNKINNPSVAATQELLKPELLIEQSVTKNYFLE